MNLNQSDSYLNPDKNHIRISWKNYFCDRYCTSLRSSYIFRYDLAMAWPFFYTIFSV